MIAFVVGIAARAVQFHLFLGVVTEPLVMRQLQIVIPEVVRSPDWRAGVPERRPIPSLLRLPEQLLDAGRGRVTARHRLYRARRPVERSARNGHGAPSQAHGPVQHVFGGTTVRVTCRAPVQHRVHDLVDEKHHEEPDAEYQVAQVLGALSVGQLTGLLEPVDAFPDLGLQVQQGGEQQHTTAEAQQQRHHRGTGGRLAAVRVSAGRRGRHGSGGRRVFSPPFGQFQRHDAQHERAQAEHEHGTRLRHGYLVH